jgi:molybdate transport system permease protein
MGRDDPEALQRTPALQQGASALEDHEGLASGGRPGRGRSDLPFLLALGVLGGVYVLLIVGMLLADASFTTPGHLLEALQSREIRYAIKLSLISCSITAILSVWVAVPLGYLLSRYQFPGKVLLDVLLDIPIVLPPLVIGLSLLILFQTPLGQGIDRLVPVTYAIPSVIVAQFAVAAAFAVRTMRVTFDAISPRQEQVALTLGCSRSQAFWLVVLPQARRGVVTAGTVAWARALGEFGPVLVFSGATRLYTEVLPTTVFLELSIGHLEGAVAVSILMVLGAIVVLLIVRVYGMEAGA